MPQPLLPPFATPMVPQAPVSTYEKPTPEPTPKPTPALSPIPQQAPTPKPKATLESLTLVGDGYNTAYKTPPIAEPSEQGAIKTNLFAKINSALGEKVVNGRIYTFSESSYQIFLKQLRSEEFQKFLRKNPDASVQIVVHFVTSTFKPLEGFTGVIGVTNSEHAVLEYRTQPKKDDLNIPDGQTNSTVPRPITLSISLTTGKIAIQSTDKRIAIPVGTAIELKRLIP